MRMNRLLDATLAATFVAAVPVQAAHVVATPFEAVGSQIPIYFSRTFAPLTVVTAESRRNDLYDQGGLIFVYRGAQSDVLTLSTPPFSVVTGAPAPAATGLDAAVTSAFSGAGVTANAAASAMRSTGQLKIASSATQAGPWPGTAPRNAVNIASAEIWDTGHLINLGTDWVPMAVNFSVEGRIAWNSDEWFGTPGTRMQHTAELVLNSACAGCRNEAGEAIGQSVGGLGIIDVMRATSFDFGAANFQTLNSVTPTGNDGALFGSPPAPWSIVLGDTNGDCVFGAGGARDCPISYTITANLWVPPGLTSLGLGFVMQLDCRGPFTCDFGNTGTISIVPGSDDLTFTSASGELLNGPPPPPPPPAVPEPASWAMLIAGFGLIGAVARRRRMVIG